MPRFIGRLLLLGAFLTMLVAACTSCAGRAGRFPSTEDEVALARQHELSTVAWVDVTASVTLDGGANVMPVGWGGTVFGIMVHDGHELLMTAGHVCVAPPGSLPYGLVVVPGSTTFVIKDFLGREHPATLVAVSSHTDMCTLSIDDVATDVVTFADASPPTGAIISTSGFPLGMHTNGRAPSFDGRWCGVITDPGEPLSAMLCIPAAPGSSGSPVFYMGRVVSVLVRGAGRFPLTSEGTGYDDMMTLVRLSSVAWLGSTTIEVTVPPLPVDVPHS